MARPKTQSQNQMSPPEDSGNQGLDAELGNSKELPQELPQSSMARETQTVIVPQETSTQATYRKLAERGWSGFNDVNLRLMDSKGDILPSSLPRDKDGKHVLPIEGSQVRVKYLCLDRKDALNRKFFRVMDVRPVRKDGPAGEYLDDAHFDGQGNLTIGDLMVFFVSAAAWEKYQREMDRKFDGNLIGLEHGEKREENGAKFEQGPIKSRLISDPSAMPG